MNAEVVAEVCDAREAVLQTATVRPNLIVVEWGLIQELSCTALDVLRAVSPASTKIVLLSSLNVRQHAAMVSGADVFISKADSTQSVVHRFRSAIDDDLG